MYERRFQPPLSRPAFIRRLTIHSGIVLVVLLASLAVGMAGYMAFESMTLADAFLHAASLLGGIGLVAVPASIHGKLFAGIYSLYAGLVSVASFGIMLAPVAHRLLHKFHWEGGRHDTD